MREQTEPHLDVRILCFDYLMNLLGSAEVRQIQGTDNCHIFCSSTGWLGLAESLLISNEKITSIFHLIPFLFLSLYIDYCFFYNPDLRISANEFSAQDEPW